MLIFNKKIFVGLMIACLVFVADQSSKHYAMKLINAFGNTSITISPFFNIVSTWNAGITFGLFNDAYYAKYTKIIFTILSMIIMLVILVWMYKSTNYLKIIAFGAILGGALGNILDRIKFGAVYDFLDFHIGKIHWYSFNIADSAILVGVLLLLLQDLRQKK